MDRLNQIRGEAGSSRDLTLDTTSPPSESFMTANESSSKYFSLSEVDSTFSISPSKDSLTVTTTDPDRTITTDAELISNLSPIPKKSDLDSYKIGKQIEAANILSGGVNIFDDNENSYDGDELVIDDNVIVEDEKSNTELKLNESPELPLDKTENLITLDDAETIPSKDTEVVLQIDGKNVDAIDIGNGLYLYRKAGEEELAAVQIINDDQQQPSFKFLKVRENAEGNLEVYEEIEIEIPKEVPTKEGNPADKSSHVPIKDINKVINESLVNKVADKTNKIPKNDMLANNDVGSETNVESITEIKSEVNLNGKMMKFNESRKSPLIGTYTPMTYHSTPNKEGIPLTKTMVDQQLHPSRHSDNVKKTIEVHTDSCRQKLLETPTKNKDLNDINKTTEAIPYDQEKGESVNESIIHEDSQEPTQNKTDLNPLDPIVNCESTKIEIKLNEEDSTAKTSKIDNAELVETTENGNVVKECVDQCQTEETEKIEVLNVSVKENIKSENATISQDDKVKPDLNEKLEVESKEDNEKLSDSQIKKDLKNCDTKTVNTNDIAKVTEKDCIKVPLDEKPAIIDSTLNTSNENKKEYTLETLSEKPKIMNLESNNEGNKESSKQKITNEIDISNNFKEIEMKILEENSSNKLTDGIEKVSEHREDESTKCQINKTDNHKEVVSITNNRHMSTITDIPNNLKENEDKISDTHSDISKNCLEKVENMTSDGKSPNSLEDVKIDSAKIDPDNKSNLKDNNVDDKSDIGKEKLPSKEGNKDILLNSEEKANTDNNECLKEPVSQSISINCEKVRIDTISSIIPSEETKTTSTILNINESVCPKNNMNKNKIETKVETKPKVVASKPINNNNSAVPFGKWTSANRQEFLNKIKETKIPSTNSNTKQLKQPNDLNRRDVLKKIDSQRQSATASAKPVDFGTAPKLNTKIETSAFINKCNVNQQTIKHDAKIAIVKNQPSIVKQKSVVTKKIHKDESIDTISATKTPVQRKAINNQDLIDKTIEDIINRAVTTKGTAENTADKPLNITEKGSNSHAVSLDDIEMKMIELHGSSYEERSSNEIQKTINNDTKNSSKPDNFKMEKASKIPNLVPFKNKDQHNIVKEKVPEELSDEEIIEHEPITGDIEVNKQNLVSLLSNKEKSLNEPRKEAIITEKDFDKFARRNSITYENCLTMSFDGKETHNVIQTIVEKDPPVKKLSRNELMLAESKAKSTSKLHHIAMKQNKISTSAKLPNEEDTFTKNYQSRVQIAYQSVLTAKRNMECPITIIEDKPVKVVYMDTNMEFTPTQLNVQGQELSPSRKQTSESSDVHSASESLDSDIQDSPNESKPQDEIKFKIKHQRKQVLTPVDEPELELIEPDDLGIEISPKKKRKLEDKTDKISKNLVPKKTYLLNRNIIDEEVSKSNDIVKNASNDTKNQSETFKSHTDTISAIDNLVKAAELIETQAESKKSIINIQSLDNSQNTPIKRGRGRPRKYPLPEQTPVVKVPSPQKKPRLIDAKIIKSYTDSDESSDGEIIKENWTMGKINENIVCPICNKLFRSENVVFKHVKHCTGPSPNRSDSDKRSPLRLRHSSERKSRDSKSDFTDDDEEEEEEKLRSRKSRHYAKSINENDDVIVIEDTPIKEKMKDPEVKKNTTKNKVHHNTNNLICEFCGKTFRQLSYLVNHKLQHKKEDLKNSENEVIKSVFSCEICKKEFRKLHHLVQHRIIHNSNSTATRLHRKSSSEQRDIKSLKNQNESKQNDDPSAGFRCEPCDKSFRKLHHLVEHRETHDGINKKGSSNTQSTNEVTKPLLVHSCDICKKVFKKLQDYLEHKELHLETSSEKSDDKSVKSSLSTKDIIHECSLCYMVFPNEHSLNKHTVICLRKKKQSAAKQAAKKAEQENIIDAGECKSDDNTLSDMDPIKNFEQNEDSKVTINLDKDSDNSSQQKEKVEETNESKISEKDVDDELEKKKCKLDTKSSDSELKYEKPSTEKHTQNITNINDTPEHSDKIKKVDAKEDIQIVDTPTPKKKVQIKEKIAPTVTKKHKTVIAPLPVVDETKPSLESSDDEEIRYMLNPNFKEDDCSEGKLFMKVRAKKRNSLQIERPSSKDLIKRRISLQHPPKIPRLKVKAVEPRPINSLTVEKKLKLSNPKPLSYTDSDDSDVKYSFPRTKAPEVATSKDVDKKSKNQSLAAKRKSLSGIAKRKSIGKHKVTTPTNKTKKRTTEIEHRCDCGQLFSSAALLSRHTTLAHTPPRIRRRRSPPPEIETQTSNKSRTNKTKQNVQSKKLKGDVTNSNTTPNLGVGTRKSSVNNSEAKVASDVSKTINIEPITKKLRSSAHRGVPVPEKMRKLMEKSKK